MPADFLTSNTFRSRINLVLQLNFATVKSWLPSILFAGVLSITAISGQTFAQSGSVREPLSQPAANNLVTVTRTDGKTITGKIVSQDAQTLNLEADGMTVSLPTRLIASVSYNAATAENAAPTRASDEGAKIADQIVGSMRKLVVANETGVSLVNFGPMLIAAKTETVEPLRKLDASGDFARAVNRSLKAYQDAFDAWQIKVKTEFVFASTDYGKWAVQNYNVQKRGLLKTVLIEEVRQAALTRGRNYFQRAESMAAEMRTVQSVPQNVQTNALTAVSPSVEFTKQTLAGKWAVELIIAETGNKETFTLEIDSNGAGGRLFGFGGKLSAIESIAADAAAQNSFLIVTAPEKMNKDNAQVMMRVELETNNRLKGSIRLRRVKDGTMSPYTANLTANRTL